MGLFHAVLLHPCFTSVQNKCIALSIVLFAESCTATTSPLQKPLGGLSVWRCRLRLCGNYGPVAMLMYSVGF